MEIEERKTIERIEKKKYKNSRLKSTKSQKSDKSENAYSKLNIKLLFDGKETETHRDTITVLERLIKNLYGDQPFFKEAVKKRPELVSDLISTMVKNAKSATCKLTFTDICELSNIPFADFELREVFYKMLKGEPASIKYNEKGEKRVVAEGYESLLDFLTVVCSRSKVRVWLARKALIESIFRDPQMIIDRRKELYRYVKEGGWSLEGAQQEFDNFKSGFSMEGISLQFVDFTVSKTSPPTN